MRMQMTSLLFALAVVACANETPPPTTPPAASPSPPASVLVTQAPEPGAGKPQHGKLYALVVSFISPGNGTDDAAYERLRNVVSDVGATRVGHVHGHWGKEGEHDECFDLAALSFTEKKAFVQRVRLASNSERVTVTENARCRNERE